MRTVLLYFVLPFFSLIFFFFVFLYFCCCCNFPFFPLFFSLLSSHSSSSMLCFLRIIFLWVLCRMFFFYFPAFALCFASIKFCSSAPFWMKTIVLVWLFVGLLLAVIVERRTQIFAMAYIVLSIVCSEQEGQYQEADVCFDEVSSYLLLLRPKRLLVSEQIFLLFHSVFMVLYALRSNVPLHFVLFCLLS